MEFKKRKSAVGNQEDCIVFTDEKGILPQPNFYYQQKVNIVKGFFIENQGIIVCVSYDKYGYEYRVSFQVNRNHIEDWIREEDLEKV